MKSAEPSGVWQGWSMALKMKKCITRFIFIVSALLLISVGAILLLIFLFPEGCDEGMESDTSVSNGRGDIAAEYIKACTSIGTNVDYSVVLRLHEDVKNITLVRYDELAHPYPKLRWIDNDTLSIDLGKVRSVWSKVDKVGVIHITYSYSKVE